MRMGKRGLRSDSRNCIVAQLLAEIPDFNATHAHSYRHPYFIDYKHYKNLIRISKLHPASLKAHNVIDRHVTKKRA